MYAEQAHNVTTMKVSQKTKRSLKVCKSISKFFTSIIGPKTIKATSDPNEKLELKEAAINASAAEHTDIKKANTIITPIERMEFCPTDNRISRVNMT